MKILHVMAGGKAGGAEMAYVDLLIAQKQAGMDVIAACRPNAQRVPLLKEAGIEVTELPFGGIFDFRTKKALRKLIQKEQPKIVQCWMSRAAKLTPTVKGVIKIARLGGYYNLKYYKGVDHFIGNTPDICRWLIEDQKVDPSRVTHINNFAELETIDKLVTKADFDTNEDDFVFLCMARLHEVKGIDIALKAIDRLENGILWIAGDGPEEKKLKAMAKDLDIEDRVRWLGWRTDRAALLQACDAVVFPSRFEPFGGTFAQAWAAKRPLITTASKGPMQYVTDQKDALVVPIDDDGELATAMFNVMDDVHMRRALAREGHAAFKAHFQKSKILDIYRDFYEALIDFKTHNSLNRRPTRINAPA